MSSGSGSYVYTSTTASVGVDIVVMTQAGAAVKVTNIGGTGSLYATVGWPGGPNTPPTLGGSQDFYCASVVGASFSTRIPGPIGPIVQLTSNVPTQYAVEVQSAHSTS